MTPYSFNALLVSALARGHLRLMDAHVRLSNAAIVMDSLLLGGVGGDVTKSENKETLSNLVREINTISAFIADIPSQITQDILCSAKKDEAS